MAHRLQAHTVQRTDHALHDRSERCVRATMLLLTRRRRGCRCIGATALVRHAESGSHFPTARQSPDLSGLRDRVGDTGRQRPLAGNHARIAHHRTPNHPANLPSTLVVRQDGSSRLPHGIAGCPLTLPLTVEQ